MGLIYGKKFLVDEWVRAWDMGAVKKHIDRLTARGMIIFSNGRYVKLKAVFLVSFGQIFEKFHHDHFRLRVVVDEFVNCRLGANFIVFS
jgi:hypothetical protein